EHWVEHHRAKRLRFTIRLPGIVIKGDNMDFTMKFDQTVNFSIAAVDAAGNPAKAVLTDVAFSSSDPSIFTVAADPANPMGGVLSGAAVGSAVLSGVATATEVDGVVHQVGGTANITLTPDNPPAASLVFTFSTPLGQVTTASKQA